MVWASRIFIKDDLYSHAIMMFYPAPRCLPGRVKTRWCRNLHICKMSVKGSFFLFCGVFYHHLMVFEMEQASILSCSLVTCPTKKRLKVLWIISFFWLPAAKVQKMLTNNLWCSWALCGSVANALTTWKHVAKHMIWPSPRCFKTKTCPAFLRNSTKVYTSAPHIFRNSI